MLFAVRFPFSYQKPKCPSFNPVETVETLPLDQRFSFWGINDQCVQAQTLTLFVELSR